VARELPIFTAAAGPSGHGAGHAFQPLTIAMGHAFQPLTIAMGGSVDASGLR